MMHTSDTPPGVMPSAPGGHVPVGLAKCVVIGDTAIAQRVADRLRDAELTEVDHLQRPGDDEVRRVVSESVSWVVILFHDDIVALRYALACAHIRPEVSILVSIFDRTIGDEVRRMLRHCEVTSPAELALPSLLDLCLRSGSDRWQREHLSSLDAARSAVSHSARGPTAHLRYALSALTTHLTGFARTSDRGARNLVVGLVGLAAILGLDFAWLITREHRSFAQGLREAVQVVTTVGPAGTTADTAYTVLSSCAMLVTVVFTAMFTAGVVDRSLGSRSLGMLGPRSMPRRHHVVVVGLGQVGARLCMELRAAGIPVVAIERDATAPGLRLIRNLRIPTIIGHGVDRWLLEETRIDKAAALAAVGSDDLDNIAVAVAAHGVAPQLHMVLRAGEQSTVTETEALLPLGSVCDVTSLTADYVTRRVLEVAAD